MIDNLYVNPSIGKGELFKIIEENRYSPDKRLIELAADKRNQVYGKKVFFRGLIEFSNYCKNDCYYCGIRKSNRKIKRYRLSKEEILKSCEEGYKLGFKTFVLQGGDDLYFTEDKMEDLIYSIKSKYDDCALTLSCGEKSHKTYKKYFEAGADRYLLRHETSNEAHYKKLHPESMSLKNRISSLYELKEIGFQVGAGFMVGSPYQTSENLVEDLLFLKKLDPDMIGIGPFIPHRDTAFSNESRGSLNMTSLMISLARLILPKALIPSTTALASIDPYGRERGLMAGANVVMPNLTPLIYRGEYSLYDDKIFQGDDAIRSIKEIKDRVEAIGLSPDFSRGDHIRLR